MIASLQIASVSPYRDRAYEWVTARAVFAVDPEHPGNSRVVDLDVAPRQVDGTVRFEADVRVLRPIAGGNGRLLFVVPNRGMLGGGLPFSFDVTPMMGPTEDPDPGDGFLLERGWTIAWCGWQWDVVRQSGWLGLDAPMATVEPGWMRVEFRPDIEEADHHLSDSSPIFQFADYPTVDLSDPEARLSVRTSPLGEKQLVPREAWRFLDDSTFTVDGGFQPFHWYELVYRPSIAPVVGTGLLAVRDLVAHLRASHEWAFAFGVSQSGRFLRQFLFDGMNTDEKGDQVFDGVFTHIASARRGEFNCRYGQPSLTHPLTPGYGPPYDAAGILARQREVGMAPKVMSTNSSWEYWRGDGALLHADPDTGDDLEEDPDARQHLIAGTDHFGPFALKEFLPVTNAVHQLDVTPILRALFVQLEQWVCEGVEPSASCVPRRADTTATTRERVLERFPEAVRPDARCLPWTPDLDARSTSWPLELGSPRVALVSDVDAGGNEVAGVRLPAVAAPLWAFTGWNPRTRVENLPDVLYEFVGSQLPRLSPTPPIDRAKYAEQVRGAARALVDRRFLLENDIDRTVEAGLSLYDAWSGSPA